MIPRKQDLFRKNRALALVSSLVTTEHTNPAQEGITQAE